MWQRKGFFPRLNPTLCWTVEGPPAPLGVKATLRSYRACSPYSFGHLKQFKMGTMNWEIVSFHALFGNQQHQSSTSSADNWNEILAVASLSSGPNGPADNKRHGALDTRSVPTKIVGITYPRAAPAAGPGTPALPPGPPESPRPLQSPGIQQGPFQTRGQGGTSIRRKLHS